MGEEEQRKRDAEEMGDAMKSLENRTLDSKREMDILSALDEMKSMKVFIMTYMLIHIDNSTMLDTDNSFFVCVFQGVNEREQRRD